jgi:diketogulonate reductase-like aldo/keto reductase
MQTSSHPVNRYQIHRGFSIPTFFYGTAWKELQTEELTRLAVDAGFRGIDTANQRRHYFEAGVGMAVQKILKIGQLKRDDLFLQSKFTYAAGQDHRLPYDPNAEYAVQVKQSFNSSLDHFQTTYLDSYVLHGPSTGKGLQKADWDVWRAMEELNISGSVRLLGVSNINVGQLLMLVEKAEVKPAFVQNRCFARTKWDAGIRELCRSHGIIYQGFSLLTANVAVLQHPVIFEMTRRRKVTLPQLVFRFALQLGMIPLTGTTSESHMNEDLAVYDLELSQTEISTIETIAT